MDIMTSQVNQIETGYRREQILKFGKRFLLILLVLSIQMLYIPTSNGFPGGIEPKLPMENYPIWPVWVLPYVLCYPLWFFGFAWVIFKMEDHLFRSFIAACLLVFTLSVSIFVLFPTYVEPAVIPGNDIFAFVLRYIHENFGRYDALPSGHIYITVLLALFFNFWYPRYKFWWILIPIIVSLSTLFTAQHYIADIFGGLVVAVMGFHFGLRWAGITLQPHSTAKSPLTEPPS